MFSRRISSSLFLVSVLGCGVASFSALEISLVSEWTQSVLGFLGLIAPFFFVDLRAKDTRDQCAKCECSCEPNAKAHHCDGA